MTTILAIDTATDACSVALYRDGEYSEIYEVIPRQHSQRLMPMLQELLPSGDLRSLGIDAIAYGSGPGSFTGLRIAASAVQGLAFANDLPTIPVSTLACQAQTAYRQGRVQSGDQVLSLLDAKINEIYWSVACIESGMAVEASPAAVCTPADIRVGAHFQSLAAVGSGLKYLEAMPEELRTRLQSTAVEVLPSAQDLIPLAVAAYSRGETQRATEVAPVYVREEISWKKLAEQGKKP
ncbi:MAG: tRNA (adenosine(37)-N6)-threonylcarbamoyltransferase complex dimerization subunit type 1 TsaB [Halioglobus sp.]